MMYSKRFHSLALSILACIFFGGSSVAVLAAEDGFQLYVEACKRSLMVSSAQAEFTCVKKSVNESEAVPEIARNLESYFSARGLFKGSHPFLTEGRKDNLYLWETKLLKDTGKSETPCSILCVGNPNFDIIGKDGKAPKKSPSSMIGAEYLCLSRVSRMSFSINTHPHWTPDFQLFGRMWGIPAQKSLWLLTTAGGQAKPKPAYSSAGLAALKKDDQKNKISYVVAGESSYDGTHKATIVDVLEGGKVSVRYWIDSSRDYICPLIQRYVPADGSIIEEYVSSDYVLDKSSGLWYPAKYVAKQHFWQFEGFTEYTLVPDSLSLNRSLPDGLFVLDVPSGEDIFDSRIGGDTVFVARDNGALSFKNGDIDLRSLSWLEEKGTAYSGDRTVKVAQAAEYTWTRIILISSGLLLILIALSVMLYRKWKGR
ncbi:hypothetical protein FACS189419_02990 [Planctomycetales bacterium]|nr:hypothetical protein FACS189419_02990 [Planctomycetales bacterium]